MRSILPACMAIIIVLFAFRSVVALTVKGKVADQTGKPLSGVTVSEKGTSNHTVTDKQGGFTLAVQQENAILVFYTSGYAAKEVQAQLKGIMRIVLHADAENKPTVHQQPRLHKTEASAAGSPALQMQAPSTFLRSKSVLDSRVSRARPYAEGTMYDVAKGKKLGYGYNTEDYDAIVENRFQTVAQHALSTFSIDVDAAAYSNVRRYLQMGQLPPAGSVRIEELINYFHYAYPQPEADVPFTVNTEMSACPWNSDHRLVLIGLQGKRIPVHHLPPSNIVFLIDVSGSMMAENKLPLVKASMKLLADQLREQDKVSVVVYAGQAGLVLPPTSGADKMTIKDAIDRLEAGGATAGGEGIRLAYETASRNFMPKGNNRVILCTDGDFNVGVSSDAELERLIEEKRQTGVFLTVLGYGMGNYKDNKMQKLADKGNGNHAYIDGLNEARKVLVHEFGGTLFTIAKDVKLQVEFNPRSVQAYRLIGYENRMLQKEDFNNDRKDAGDLGSGHTVTALYEVIPAGVKNRFMEPVDELKYQLQQPPVVHRNAGIQEIMTIKLRYKETQGTVSKLITHPVVDRHTPLEKTSANFRFAAAVAESGMLLLGSEFRQASSYDHARQMAAGALDKDEAGYRKEFYELLRLAQSIAQQHTESQHRRAAYVK